MENIPEIEKETHRLAVVNMDWRYVKVSKNALQGQIFMILFVKVEIFFPLGFICSGWKFRNLMVLNFG